MIDRILRLPEVIHTVGLSRSSIYSKISQGTFPKPLKISARSIGWTDQSIKNWIDEQIQKSAALEGLNNV